MDGNTEQQPTGTGGNWRFRPGETAGLSAQVQQQDPQTITQPAPQNPVFADSQPALEVSQPSPQSMLHPDDYVPALSQASANDLGDSVSWTASEFIAHQKNAGWYGVLALGTIILACGIFFLTKDKISTSVVIVAAIVFGVYAARKPRTLTYRIDGSGLTIGSKAYGYGQFRSFAILSEGVFSSIILTPLRRLTPPLSIYYDPKDEQRIVGVLADRLPMETHKLDVIDQLMRRVRF